jgi:hypothetical protein
MSGLKMTTGLQRLVLQHHNSFADAAMPVFIVCFDKAGSVVPTDQAAKASTQKSRTKGGLESFRPVPGEGYYAHMQRSHERIDRETGSMTEWKIEGPDWAGTVTVHRAPSGAWSGATTIEQISDEGVAFLEQFA